MGKYARPRIRSCGPIGIAIYEICTRERRRRRVVWQASWFCVWCGRSVCWVFPDLGEMDWPHYRLCRLPWVKRQPVDWARVTEVVSVTCSNRTLPNKGPSSVERLSRARAQRKFRANWLWIIIERDQCGYSEKVVTFQWRQEIWSRIWISCPIVFFFRVAFFYFF